MVTIHVCIGSSCHLKGSYNLINAFQQAIEENKLNDKVEVRGTFCLGHCGENVSCKVDEEYFGVSPETANDFFRSNVMPKVK